MNCNCNIKLLPTKVFETYEINDSNIISHRNIDMYKVLFENDLNFRQLFVKHLKCHGCCILSGFISKEVQQSTLKVLSPFIRKMISKYDFQDDEFLNIDQDEFNIVRMPRIGNGKHNIHFDPHLSSQHLALNHLAENARFSELLSLYMKKSCILRETGISITRPKDENRLSEGEGMEWHSDGSYGEATVLMSLEDILPEQGSLRVVPNSHKESYVDGIGYDEEILYSNRLILERNLVRYNYEAMCPMVIDARTLHSVSPNTSSKWRVIVWFIFDSY